MCYKITSHITPQQIKGVKYNFLGVKSGKS